MRGARIVLDGRCLHVAGKNVCPNMEQPAGRRITNNGGDFWCFGLKIEQFGTIVKTMNGGRTEVEGGFNLPINPDLTQQPAFECIDASHSLSFTGFAFQQYHAWYNTQIRETKEGVTLNLNHADTEKRVNRWSDVVPLHVGRLTQFHFCEFARFETTAVMLLTP
jgi:hypothetical protein